MSAGVCGKRPRFEDIFGSSSSPSLSWPIKRSRCSDFGFGGGSEDKISVLLRMFPSMDPQLVERVLNTHNHKIEDAIESLNALCLRDVSSEAEFQSFGSTMMANSHAEPESNQASEQKIEDLQDKGSTPESRSPMDGSSWVDIFVQEMMNASNLDDARGRAARLLEAFEKNVLAHSRASQEQEIATLREHLQNMLRDNQILKRAVAIQHERTLEQEGKVREAEQLKHAIAQYQEQIKTLELNNYTLNLHLQRAQKSSSMPGHFHPDVF